MRILILLSLFALPLGAMDKILAAVVHRSPRDKDEKKEEHSASTRVKTEKKEEKSSSPRAKAEKKGEKEKTRTPRGDKEKQLHRDPTLARFAERRASDTPAARETKSASPSSNSASPLRGSTVGKRGSLDWTTALKESGRHIHADESIRQWSQKDATEEKLKKLFEEFSTSTAERQKEIYCTIMNTSIVSATKEAMATNFFTVSYKIAAAALYNIPNYYTVKNSEEARLEIRNFYKALYDLEESYIHQISAQGPRRDKWSCQQAIKTQKNSAVVQLLAQLEALKTKYEEHKKDFEPELILLPEFKKP
ncbi:hypothetical protein BH09DEP1_BH09DEP1_1030 [soil metagenome]